MKIPNVPGEWAFRALLKDEDGWYLSPGYFFSQKEVMDTYKDGPVIWPVEKQEGDMVYVPAQDELEDGKS